MTNMTNKVEESIQPPPRKDATSSSSSSMPRRSSMTSTSTTARSAFPLSSPSPFRATFSSSSPPFPIRKPRNPLTPHYQLPSYTRCPLPSPPPVLTSSLDISDIEGARPLQAEREEKTKKRERERQSPSFTSPPSHLTPPFATIDPPPLSPLPSPSPSSPPLRPSTAPAAPSLSNPRSFPHRFQHSPNIAVLPTSTFTQIYHPALHDPLPSFSFAIHRPFHMPAHHAPLGGVEGRKGKVEEEMSKRREKKKWKAKDMLSTPARVSCWRESMGEVGRDERREEWEEAFREVDMASVQRLS